MRTAFLATFLCAAPVFAAGGFKTGEPISYKNLTVFPVTKRGAADPHRYLSLEEAQKQGLVRITERGNDSDTAQVSEVFVSNLSTRPIFLVGGEVILGGKQDRVIREDVVVPPLSMRQAINVFCVEQGRWHGKSMSFRAADQMIDTSVREEAALGSQGGVWSKVARKEKSLGGYSVGLGGGGSYRGVIDNKGVRTSTDEFVNRLGPALRAAGTVGLVAAVNGRIRAVDVFQSPSLFARFRDKLLRSYAVQAIEATGIGFGEGVAAPAKQAAEEFLTKSMKARPASAVNDVAGSNAKLNAPEMKGTERRDKDGGWIHKTYFKKD